MSKFTDIHADLDYLQMGDTRAVGNEPDVDDTLNLLRRVCAEVERLEERVRDLERHLGVDP